MQDLRDTLGAKMSTGMKQKTSIARALVHDPAGDRVRRGDQRARRVRGPRVARHGQPSCATRAKCIVFSTHIMSEVQRLCDRIGVMHRGRLIDIGPTDDLRQRHGEDDLEELFFHLVTSAESASLEKEGAA